MDTLFYSDFCIGYTSVFYGYIYLLLLDMCYSDIATGVYFTWISYSTSKTIHCNNCFKTTLSNPLNSFETPALRFTYLHGLKTPVCVSCGTTHAAQAIGPSSNCQANVYPWYVFLWLSTLAINSYSVSLSFISEKSPKNPKNKL